MTKRKKRAAIDEYLKRVALTVWQEMLLSRPEMAIPPWDKNNPPFRFISKA